MTEQVFFLVFALVSVFIGLIYTGFILYLSLVFKHGKRRQKQMDFEPFISFIIAFRNEEKTLPTLLQSVAEQNYPKSKIEIILVDDSSNDRGLEHIQSFQEKHPELPIKLLELKKEKPGAFGKKEALLLAYSKASGDYILLSDADCYFGKNNFKSRVQAFRKPKVKMVSAAVLIKQDKTLFTSAQALENLSLMATTAATTTAGLAILSNGANLAFKRESYLKLAKNALVQEESSGDDLFLLHTFKKRFGANSIAFEFDNNSVVYTEAQPDFKTFFNQRVRWVSKSKSYKDVWIIMVSLLVLFMNLNILFAASAFVFNPDYLYIFGILFGLKFSIDFLILSSVAKWYKQRELLWIYPLVQIFYPFFIVLNSLFASFLSYEWKGRKY